MAGRVGPCDGASRRGSDPKPPWPAQTYLCDASAALLRPSRGSSNGRTAQCLASCMRPGSIDDVRLVADLTASSLRLEAGTLGPSSVHVEAAAGRGRALDLFAFGDFLGGRFCTSRVSSPEAVRSLATSPCVICLSGSLRLLSRRELLSDRPPGPRIDARLSGNLTARPMTSSISRAHAYDSTHPFSRRKPATPAFTSLPREKRFSSARAGRAPYFDVRVPNGPPAFASLWGMVASIARKPEVNLSVAVPPLDLSILSASCPSSNARKERCR